METTIAAVIIVALILFGMLTLAHGYLSAQDEILQSWRATEQRMQEQARTSLQLVEAAILPSLDEVELTIRNDGSTRLADLETWDIVLEYDAMATWVARWYPYASPLARGQNEWTIVGIYQDAAQARPEVREPGILNPGEEMVVRIAVSPPVLGTGGGVAAIAAPNGVGASAILSAR
ncbi:MAG: hypothetical protein K6V36_05725 [Anaerolineae bacterium]|nr:hypothetical protein [Anaerolineae bacterium]